jgi:hypothetical protein
LTESDLLTPESFEKLVEDLVYESDDQLSYVEAVVEICENRGMEVESVTGILTAALKSKLESGFMRLHMLPQKAQLPEEW